VKGISAETDGLPLGPIAVVAGALVVLALLLLGPLRRGGLRPGLLRRGGGGGEGSRASFQQAPAPPPPAVRTEPRTTPREPVDWPRAEAQADTASGKVPIRAPIATRPDPEPEEVGFCTECGRPLREEHKFCGFCGHKAR
jgi:hypothetical protein